MLATHRQTDRHMQFTLCRVANRFAAFETFKFFFCTSRFTNLIWICLSNEITMLYNICTLDCHHIVNKSSMLQNLLLSLLFCASLYCVCWVGCCCFSLFIITLCDFFSFFSCCCLLSYCVLVYSRCLCIWLHSRNFSWLLVTYDIWTLI